MPKTIPYASPTVVRSSRGFYRAALTCAILPMSAGILILLAYLVTRSDVLPSIGFLLLLAGPAIIVIGIGLLITHYVLSRNTCETQSRLRWHCLGTMLLLILNIPVAFACMTIGFRETLRQQVTVINTGSQQVESFIVTFGDGTRLDFGSLSPGKAARRSGVANTFSPAVTFQATVAGRNLQGKLPNFLTAATARTILFNGQTATAK